MCQRAKCCCCLPLRTGCMVIAILTIIHSFTWYIFGSRGPRVGYGYIVFINLWGLAEGTCLLIGAFVSNATLVLVHLILAIIGTVVTLILMIVNMVLWNTVNTGTPNQAEQVGAGLVVMIWAIVISVLVIAYLVKIYFIVVAWFFYKELKTGGDNLPHPS